MKCFPENVEMVFNALLQNLEDENGRGEFDGETEIADAVEKVIEWIENDEELKKQVRGNYEKA